MVSAWRYEYLEHEMVLLFEDNFTQPFGKPDVDMTLPKRWCSFANTREDIHFAISDGYENEGGVIQNQGTNGCVVLYTAW